jgi:hypothetical protein
LADPISGDESGYILSGTGLGAGSEKTRLIEFGRFAAKDRKARGLGKPETYRIYQLGLWLAIFFAIFHRLPPNKFLRIPPGFAIFATRQKRVILMRSRLTCGPAYPA